MNHGSIQTREATTVGPATEQTAPRANVLLIRRRPDPTDEIYVLAPLRELLTRGEISLDALDIGSRLRTAAQLRPHLQNRTHVIVSRYCPGPWVDALLECSGRMFEVCYLADDDIPAGAKTNTLPLTYRFRMATVARREFSRFLSGADRILVTSKHLANRYDAENLNLLPPVNIWPTRSLDHHENPETIVVSFHATAIHQGDLAAITPALKEIHEMRPSVRIEIVTDGRVPPKLRRLARCRTWPDMSWSDYKKFVQGAESHIGLAPLMDSPFNQGKSHIKLFDITAMGAVGVYSKRPPYTEVIEDGVNGLLVDDDVNAWSEAIVKLADNPKRMKSMVENAQAHVVDIGNPKRLETFWSQVFGLEEIPEQRM